MVSSVGAGTGRLLVVSTSSKGGSFANRLLSGSQYALNLRVNAFVGPDETMMEDGTKTINVHLNRCGLLPVDDYLVIVSTFSRGATYVNRLLSHPQ